MASVRSVTTLPEVDLRHPPGQLRTRLREVAHEVGFFYLTGHRVPESLIARVLADFEAVSRKRANSFSTACNQILRNVRDDLNMRGRLGRESLLDGGKVVTEEVKDLGRRRDGEGTHSWLKTIRM